MSLNRFITKYHQRFPRFRIVPQDKDLAPYNRQLGTLVPLLGGKRSALRSSTLTCTPRSFNSHLEMKCRLAQRNSSKKNGVRMIRRSDSLLTYTRTPYFVREKLDFARVFQESHTRTHFFFLSLFWRGAYAVQGSPH